MSRFARFFSFCFGNFNRRKRSWFSRRNSGPGRALARLHLLALEERTMLSASIFGTIFNDLNHAGIYQTVDPALVEKTVFLDLNNDGKFDSTTATFANNSPTVNTDNAFESFGSTIQVQTASTMVQNVTVSLDVTNNGATAIQINLVSPLGITGNNGPLLFYLQPGETFDGTLDSNSTNPISLAGSSPAPGTYAPQQSFASPQQFIDTGNPNGTWGLYFFNLGDASQIDLRSWSLTVTQPDPSTTTDANGNYSFTGLTPSNTPYHVGVILPSADTVTTPTAGSDFQYVTVSQANPTATGVDFGVTTSPSLAGVAFSLAAPATAWGQPVTVDYTLTNKGDGDAPAFTVDLVLSSTGVISDSGPLLYTLTVDPLAAGASFSGSQTVSLPTSAPAGFGSLSTTYIGFVIDPHDQVNDSDRVETSNEGAGIDLALLGANPNSAVTTASGIQQAPAIAVDPLNSRYLVTAYLDYSLVNSGFAGIGIGVSTNGGQTWTNSSIALPAGFEQGAAAPSVAFDSSGNLFVSFMAATFLGSLPNLTNPDSSQRYLGFQSNNGIFVAESGDGGLTFSAPVAVNSFTDDNASTQTTSANAVTPGSMLVTPAAMSPGIAVGNSLIIDYGRPDEEVVRITAVTATTFTATFANAHLPGFTINTPVDFDANPSLAVDPVTGSVYVTWAQFYPNGMFPGESGSTGGSDIEIAVSTDHGASFQTKVQTVPGTGAGTGVVSVIQDPNDYNDASLPIGEGLLSFPSVTVGPSAGGGPGVVYVATNTGGHFTVYSSTNEASSFTAPNFNDLQGTAFDYNGTQDTTDPSLLNEGLVRTVNTRQIVADPLEPGVLYAVADNALDQALPNSINANGIIFAVSDDYGVDWTSNYTVGNEAAPLSGDTPAETVNSIPVLNDENAGQYPGFASSSQTQVIAGQAIPELTVGANGEILVIWYDTRGSATNTTIAVWGTVSTDGGQHFSANFEISDTSFNPAAGVFTDANGNQEGYLGDQIGAVLVDNTAYAVWTDARNGSTTTPEQNIYLASLDLAVAPASPTDRFSPNSTMASATPLGSVIAQLALPRLELPAGSGSEWFTLQAGATGQLIVAVTPDIPGTTLDLEILDGSGNVLTPEVTSIVNSAGVVIGQQYVIAATSGSKFYLHVSGVSGDGIGYSLSAQALTYDFGTQVVGTAPAAPESGESSVAAGGVDVYRVVTGVQGTLDVTLTADTDNAGNINLVLLGADGHTILASDYLGVGSSDLGTGVGTDTEQFNLAVTQGQVVFLEVLGTNLGGTGGFTLQFTNFDQYEVAPTPAPILNEQEDNLPAGGFNFFVVTAGASGAVNATLTANADLHGSLVLQLYSYPAQNFLAQSTTVSAGGSAVENMQLSPGQSVYVAVTGADDTSSGDYTLTFPALAQADAGIDTLFIPTQGDPVSIAVANFPGDNGSDIITSTVDGTNSVSVLVNNGDGTFQSAEEYAVGPGLATAGNVTNRQLVVADLDGNATPDVVVPNAGAGTVSVLLGDSDGTLQPDRIFNAPVNVQSMVSGDLRNNGVTDLVALQGFVLGGNSSFAVLLGRGDGTFLPPVTYETMFTDGAGPILLGRFDTANNNNLDVVVFSPNQALGEIFLGNGDGTFQPGRVFATGENTGAAIAADLTGDGKLDLVTAGTNSGNVYVMVGNGNGTFQAPVSYQAMAPAAGTDVTINGLDIVDFGSAPAPGSTDPGAPDGHLDIVVAAEERSGAGGGEVILLPGLVDGGGAYAGFGGPVVLADVASAGAIVDGHFSGGTTTDLAVADTGGVLIIYGQSLALAPNTSVDTARDMGDADHIVSLTEAVVPGYEDAYFSYTVPTEAAPASGDQVIDFSALVQYSQNLGLQVEVLDSAGNILGAGNLDEDGALVGSGARFLVTAPQGEILTIHVYGMSSDSGTGVGAYTLDIDVLPQVVSLAAESALPGGPATSLVLTLQGDNLDAASAEDPANYTVIWFGPDGIQGSADNQILPVSATAGAQAIVYNPGSNVDISTGLTYPTAIQQTITLSFAAPLPAGSYEVILGSDIETAAYSAAEAGLLVTDNVSDATGRGFLGTLSGGGLPVTSSPSGYSYSDHGVVSVVNGTVTNGGGIVVPGLVTPAADPAPVIEPDDFLSQLYADLGTTLNALLAAEGDSPSISTIINGEINSRFAPIYAPPIGGGSSYDAPDFIIFWFDPVSIDLQSPQAPGQAANYSLQTNVESNNLNRTYVSVGSNVEVVVLAGVSGTFNLNLGDVPPDARGGVVVLGAQSGNQMGAFTDALRGGTTQFSVTVDAGIAQTGAASAAAIASSSAENGAGLSGVSLSGIQTVNSILVASLLVNASSSALSVTIPPTESSAGNGAAQVAEAAASATGAASGGGDAPLDDDTDIFARSNPVQPQLPPEDLVLAKSALVWETAGLNLEGHDSLDQLLGQWNDGDMISWREQSTLLDKLEPLPSEPLTPLAVDSCWTHVARQAPPVAPTSTAWPKAASVDRPGKPVSDDPVAPVTNTTRFALANEADGRWSDPIFDNPRREGSSHETNGYWLALLLLPGAVLAGMRESAAEDENARRRFLSSNSR